MDASLKAFEVIPLIGVAKMGPLKGCYIHIGVGFEVAYLY